MNYENDAVAGLDSTLSNLDELWSSLTRDTVDLQKTYQQYLTERHLADNKEVLQAGLDHPALGRVLALSTEGFKTGLQALVTKLIDLALRIFAYLKSALGVYAWRGREINRSGQALLEIVAGVQNNPTAGKINSDAAIANLHVNGRFPSSLPRSYAEATAKWTQIVDGLDSSKFTKLIDTLASSKDAGAAIGDVRTEINQLFYDLTPITDTDPAHYELSKAMPGQDFRVSRVLLGQRFIYSYLPETNDLVGKFKAGVVKDKQIPLSAQPVQALLVKDVEALGHQLMEFGSQLSRVSDAISEVERLERYIKRLNASADTKPQELASVVAYPQAFQALYNGVGAALITISRAVVTVCKLSAAEHLKKSLS